MVNYEQSRERRGRRDNNRGGRSFGNRGPRRDNNRGGRSFGGDRRGSRDNNRGGRETEMTKVTCSECGDECEVPFKPKSSKPLFCDKCFAQKGKSNSSQSSNRDLDVINEKLNKIMKALKIE
tara:strand:+ start:912 stop:1277 length:366 start_codon:yes stop_codon:yes gene_type:complete